MNDSDNCASSGPDRAALFAEITELKSQRDELQTALTECRRENQELRRQLGRGQ